MATEQEVDTATDTTTETIEVSGSEVEGGAEQSATTVTDEDLSALESLFSESAPEKETEDDETFYGGKPEEETEIQPLTNDELQAIDEQLSALSMEVVGQTEKLSEYEAKINALAKEMEEKDSIIDQSYEQWKKVTEHPQIGKLVKRLIEGQEVNLPDIIEKFYSETDSAIPDLSDAEHAKEVPSNENDLTSELKRMDRLANPKWLWR